MPVREPLPGIWNLDQPNQLSNRHEAEVTGMYADVQDSAIHLAIQGVLKRLPLRRVRDLPFGIGLLLPSDIEEDDLPGRNAKKILQMSCQFVIEHLALEQVGLGNHVLQGVGGIHEEKIALVWVVVCNVDKVLNLLGIKMILHVSRHVLMVVVPVPTVAHFAGVAEQTFAQGLVVHEPRKPRRNVTKIINMVAIIHSGHVLALLGQGVPQLSHRIANGGQILVLVRG